MKLCDVTSFSQIDHIIPQNLHLMNGELKIARICHRKPKHTLKSSGKLVRQPGESVDCFEAALVAEIPTSRSESGRAVVRA